jgi:hypothetical protein
MPVLISNVNVQILAVGRLDYTLHDMGPSWRTAAIDVCTVQHRHQRLKVIGQLHWTGDTINGVHPACKY